MPTPNPVANLRDLLASFYPDEPDQQRVVEDAGINIAQLTFNSSAINNWRVILAEAEKLDKVEALIEVILNRYGTNPQLRSTIKAYRAFLLQKNGKESESNPDSGPTSKSWIQTRLGSWWQKLSLSHILNVVLVILLVILGWLYWQTIVPQDPTTTIRIQLLGIILTILTFVIRSFFAIAGISALFYLLLGAFAWVTSGGDKDALTEARDKIQVSVVGMILIVAVLSLIFVLEQIVFRGRISLGISAPIHFP